MRDIEITGADAPWRQKATRLPIPTPPLPGELVVSFIRRLATVNRIDALDLLSCLGSRQRHPLGRGTGTGLGKNAHDLTLNHAAIDRLATYSGSSPTALLNATRANLITAGGHEPHLAWTAVFPLGATGNRSRIIDRLAYPCRRCTASLAQEPRAILLLAEARPGLCLTHQTTLERVARPTVERALGHCPEILAAARRHQIVRRRRRSTARLAFNTAARLTRQWRLFAHKQRSATDPISLRWLARADRLDLSHKDEIVRYPETVALTDLLSTLPWPAADTPSRPLITTPVVFLARAAQYLDHPQPRDLLRRGNPLCRWAGIPEGPGYWWREHAAEPDRTAYFALRNLDNT